MQTLEQRSSSAAFNDFCKLGVMAEKGEKPLKTTNNTVAPNSRSGLINNCLLVLHAVVFVASAWVHPPSLLHADRVLPQVSFGW